jgi:hypothetical protein
MLGFERSYGSYGKHLTHITGVHKMGEWLKCYSWFCWYFMEVEPFYWGA